MILMVAEPATAVLLETERPMAIDSIEPSSSAVTVTLPVPPVVSTVESSIVAEMSLVMKLAEMPMPTPLPPVEIAAPGQPCPETNAAAGRCRTPSATTADLYVAYGGFAQWRLSLNVNNLTDRDPRNYDARKGGYDIAYDDPRGRYYLLSAAYRF